MSNLEIATRHITKQWNKILDPDDELGDIFGQIGNNFLPDACHIFRFASEPIKRIRVVILGQDPYFKSDMEPHGLAFSSLSEDKCPNSLNRINKLLMSNEILVEEQHYYDLQSWARQGVLLLNTSLTVEEGKANSHKKIWRNYITGLIMRIDRIRGDKVHWLLWGEEAKSIGNFITNGNKMEWCHPNGQIAPTFKHCDHFLRLEDMKNPIEWSVNRQITNWYTDGACSNNQHADKAIAGWAYLQWRDGYSIGEMPHKYGPVKLVGEIKFKNTTYDARPTSQRGEGFALLNCMKAIYYSGINGKHIINTDSKFWVNMLQDGPWMFNWLDNGDSFNDHKNGDLTPKIWKWWCLIDDTEHLSCELEHVQAAHNYSRPGDDDPDGQQDWDGNTAVDMLAKKKMTKRV